MIQTAYYRIRHTTITVFFGKNEKKDTAGGNYSEKTERSGFLSMHYFKMKSIASKMALTCNMFFCFIKLYFKQIGNK